jgi:hypothetical protein
MDKEKDIKITIEEPKKEEEIKMNEPSKQKKKHMISFSGEV